MTSGWRLGVLGIAFLALFGLLTLRMWQIQITEAAEYTERAQLPGHYDEGLHSMDYLMYAMLQTARDSEALDLLARLGEIDKTHPENFKVAYTFASSPARYALERREWEEASRLEMAHSDFAWEDFGWARSIHHFARGIGAARSGQLERARQELEVIDTLESVMLPLLVATKA